MLRIDSSSTRLPNHAKSRQYKFNCTFLDHRRRPGHKQISYRGQLANSLSWIGCRWTLNNMKYVQLNIQKRKKEKKIINQFNLHNCRRQSRSRTIPIAYANGPKRPDHFTIYFCVSEYLRKFHLFIHSFSATIKSRRKRTKKENINHICWPQQCVLMRRTTYTNTYFIVVALLSLVRFSFL